MQTIQSPAASPAETLEVVYPIRGRKVVQEIQEAMIQIKLREKALATPQVEVSVFG